MEKHRSSLNGIDELYSYYCLKLQIHTKVNFNWFLPISIFYGKITLNPHQLTPISKLPPKV